MTKRQVWWEPSNRRNQITSRTEREGPILSGKTQRTGLTPKESEFWHQRFQRKRTCKWSGRQDKRWSYWEGSTFGREGGDQGGKSISWGMGISTRGQEKEETCRQLGFWANGNHSSGMICYFHRCVPKYVLSKWTEKAFQMKQEGISAQSCCQVLHIQHP